MIEYDKNRVNELIIDEWIWVVFIILSILNITGDEIEKEFCFSHEQKEKETAKKIFKFTVFVSFLIYAYLAYKNYKKYNIAKKTNQDTFLTESRFFASTLVVIASSIFLYDQFKDTTPTNPSIE